LKRSFGKGGSGKNRWEICESGKDSPDSERRIRKRFAVMRDEFGKQANFGVLKQSFTRKHRKRRRFQSLSLKSPAAACWSSVSDLAPFHSAQQTTLRLEFNFIICFCKLEEIECRTTRAEIE